jgi:hypothetical protein
MYVCVCLCLIYIVILQHGYEQGKYYCVACQEEDYFVKIFIYIFILLVCWLIS